MTRTTVRPRGALVGSLVGSRGSLVGSFALVGWRVRRFVGSLVVVSLAWLVGSLVCSLAASLVASLAALACSPAWGIRTHET